ncbi:MAG: SHOCT domain-containing protein [Deltaproteobacteria bacterium]|nr:SHOCT domain-containing protein [Deltaproteobacteria bacterium]
MDELRRINGDNKNAKATEEEKAGPCEMGAVVVNLERLAGLRERGLITEEEFNLLKKSVSMSNKHAFS